MPNGQASTLFGSAQPLFGAPSQSSPTPPASTPAKKDETPDISSLSISAAALGPPLPAYQPPQYLSTIGEYIPPLDDIEMEEDDEEADEFGPEIAEIKDDKWDKILPKTVDEVFETFARKLQSAEYGEKQVLRLVSSLPSSLFPPPSVAHHADYLKIRARRCSITLCLFIPFVQEIIPKSTQHGPETARGRRRHRRLPLL